MVFVSASRALYKCNVLDLFAVRRSQDFACCRSFGEASLSICILVITFLIFPPPRMSSFVTSYNSQPVAITIALTFRLIVSGFMSSLIASYLHAATHFAHEAPLQCFSSIAYLKGKSLIMNNISSLCLIQTKIKFIRHFNRTRLSACIAANALIVHKPRFYLYGHIIIPFLS